MRYFCRMGKSKTTSDEADLSRATSSCIFNGDQQAERDEGLNSIYKGLCIWKIVI